MTNLSTVIYILFISLTKNNNSFKNTNSFLNTYKNKNLTRCGSKCPPFYCI